MPGYLLTADTRVMCAHGAPAAALSLSTRVFIQGQPVVPGGEPWQVSGCMNPAPPVAPGPCISAHFLPVTTRVKVDGRGVLFPDTPCISSPPGAPPGVVFTQARVKGS